MRIVPIINRNGESLSNSAMAGWDDLPAELRSLVLSFAIAAAQKRPKAHHLSSYAAVCKEWQHVVEPVNFGSLKLTASDLTDFDALVVGPRRRWLKYVWFRVELPKYPKKKSHTPETEEEQDENDRVFSHKIASLFEVLSTWPEEDSSGIELELSARSPSDTQALAGAAGLTEDGESRYFDSHLDFAFLDTGWFGSHGLVEVYVVTKLSILRRCWRNLEPRAILTIVSSLPRLREVRYEPFQQFDDGSQEIIDMDRARELPFWPSTLQRISFFEHFDPINEETESNEEDDDFEDEDGSEQGDINETEPRTCIALAMSFARRSIQLEELAVSFMIDARHFFQPFFEARLPASKPELPFWSSLRWLTLTSSAIHYDEEADRLDAVFLAAGRAAKRMPQLRVMELYNVCKHSAGVFRYMVTEGISGTPSIGWEGTWQYDMGERVKRVWGEVAWANVSKALVVRPEEVMKYEGMFKFIHNNLATRELVLHWVSSTELLGKKEPLPVPRLSLR
ncbi:hypothetical protein SODALDRAFT_297800 [Sodiomyces alkalinus F11]|uniref:DUF6546 domain-containing protein n=1 Tax=Sodiomyces alkalinus (strain CBS 110278 / VKM F-3762 / F11) TaxID=1314773 RepID=A0A3N2PSR2_SODAK|nr:hypothetical protein SODALDRAFT_297800 [Sodiomyces alkalinus F11]ROT37559.1 hypothetical protein SODALDRAFT_297800 [Sodiomyces alkalinus F11]